jgi:PKD repeat protein/flagellar hook assembly protein FlgD
MRMLRWFLALLLLSAAQVVAAAGVIDELKVGGYELVSSRRLSVTETELTYRVKLLGATRAYRTVEARAISSNPNTTVVRGTASFGAVAESPSRTSSATITVHQKSSEPFRVSNLQWMVSSATAGPIQVDFSFTPQGVAGPVAVRFTPIVVSELPITTFLWVVRDASGANVGVNSEGRGSDVIFNLLPGQYQAYLQVTDTQGRVASTGAPVTIPLRAATVTATPTNGPAPLTVLFKVGLTAADAVTRYEWDFDGDGVIDRSVAPIADTSFTYNTPGVYAPVVRIYYGAFGLSAVAVASPSMEVRVGAAGSPQATLALSAQSGAAPLLVTHTATAANLLGRTVQSYQWDVDGNGVFDATTTTNTFTQTYSNAGDYFPRARVTLSDGSIADDVKPLRVTAVVSLALNGDSIDALQAQSVTATTTLNAPTRVSLVVESRPGVAVRTLLPLTNRGAGSYTDTWDGKNDQGQFVPQGVYRLILLYESNGVIQRFDRSPTTGGTEFLPPRTYSDIRFEPYNNKPLAIDFTLARASEVSVYLGSDFVVAPYFSLFLRQPYGPGTHRITWNGDNVSTGQLIALSPGDSFVFGIFGYTLSDNAVFVRNTAQLSAMQASPPIFDPTREIAGGPASNCTITFSLSTPAAVELTVRDTFTGAVLLTRQYTGLAAGTNSVLWDGKTSDGRLAYPGTYRLGLTAVLPSGARSMSTYVLQRVFY